jgi:ABC-type lipoprotein release transport system permease subunit
MFRLAWKNLLYYKGRSITTIVLTFVSTLMFIVYVSMMDGSHKSMLENALKVYKGGIEIYKKGYRDIGGYDYLITDVKSVEKKLDQIEGVEHYTARFETFGLLSSKEYSVASMVAGVEPTKEAGMSQLKEALIDGEFLKAKKSNCIYMGVDMLKKLHVKVGSEISFIGSASDNSFAADLFTVCGSFKTGSFDFDSSTAFVSRSYFDELMLAQNKASYINVKVHDLTQVDRISKEIEAVIDKDLESVTWKVLMKAMVEAMEVDSVFGYISLSLFFVVIFFVIMIFGFINVSARVREFGTLRCIGLSRKNIRMLLFYEMFILSTIAVLIATPLGGYINYYYAVNPIIIEGISETYKDYGIVSDELPFDFSIFTISWNVAVIYILNFISIIYPASYINAFKPIEATHHV